MCRNMFLHDPKSEQLYRYNSGPQNEIERKEYSMGLFPQCSTSRIIQEETSGEMKVNNLSQEQIANPRNLL